MPRVRKGAARRRKHNRVLKDARGMYGAMSRRYRLALDKTFRAGRYATRDRRTRKRDFRRLWVTRLSAACKQRGLAYSRFIFALEAGGITLNRKMLSEIAIADPAAFDTVVEMVRDNVPANATV
ncbi:MAG: 50S ribosomal protein L20 [Planctomycetota bacterium]|nr:50S ribosomal protein L20 [Planctomycetota bacterium]